MKAGLVERVECEYIRPGTQTLIANVEVATGQVMAPSVGPSRTAEDVVSHRERTIACDPAAEWMFIVDRLNTHHSESLVCFVAHQCGIDAELGVKGTSGVLASMPARAAFWQDPTHRLRLVYTPKHTSWLNQVEIWCGILGRRLLKRGSFPSVTELRQRMFALIEYFHQTMAKPFKWTYAGRPVVASSRKKLALSCTSPRPTSTVKRSTHAGVRQRVHSRRPPTRWPAFAIRGLRSPSRRETEGVGPPGALPGEPDAR